MPYKDLETRTRKDYLNSYQKEWNEQHKERRKQIMDKSNKKRKKYPNRILANSEANKRKLHRHKLKTLNIYGFNCQFCNEARYELLTVDHINNDGSIHKKTPEYRRYSNMWDYLAHTEYKPDLYQILCFNCNSVKFLYGIEPNKNSYQPISYWEQYSAKRIKKSKE